jgi:hypothetical protein
MRHWRKDSRCDLFVYRWKNRYLFVVRRGPCVTAVLKAPNNAGEHAMGSALHRAYEQWVADGSEWLRRSPRSVREQPYYEDIRQRSPMFHSHDCRWSKHHTQVVAHAGFGKIGLNAIAHDRSVFRWQGNAGASLREVGRALLAAFARGDRLPKTRFQWVSKAQVYATADGFVISELGGDGGYSMVCNLVPVQGAAGTATLGQEIIRALQRFRYARQAKGLRDAPRRIYERWEELSERCPFASVDYSGVDAIKDLNLCAFAPEGGQPLAKRTLPVSSSAATIGEAVARLLAPLRGTVPRPALTQRLLGELFRQGAYRAVVIRGTNAVAVQSVLTVLREAKALAWQRALDGSDGRVVIARLTNNSFLNLESTLELLARVSRQSVETFIVIAAKSTDAFLYGHFVSRRRARLLVYGIHEQHSWEGIEGKAEAWERAILGSKNIKAGSSVIITDALACAETAIRHAVA